MSTSAMLKKMAAPFLTLPKLWPPKVPLFKEKIHAHPRSRLNAAHILLFLSITFGGFEPSHGLLVFVEVGDNYTI
jgi:hypothetical protein